MAFSLEKELSPFTLEFSNTFYLLHGVGKHYNRTPNLRQTRKALSKFGTKTYGCKMTRFATLYLAFQRIFHFTESYRLNVRLPDKPHPRRRVPSPYRLPCPHGPCSLRQGYAKARTFDREGYYIERRLFVEDCEGCSLSILERYARRILASTDMVPPTKAKI